LGGYTLSFGAGDPDMYLVKADSQGNLEWQQTFGGLEDDICYSVRQTSEGGYILGGYTNSFLPGTHMYIVKTNFLGDLEWQQFRIGYICHAVQQTGDGGYILGGQIFSYPNFYMYLVRLEGIPNLTVTLVPMTLPIQIPALGGSFDFLFFVANNENDTVTVDIWTEVILPDGSLLGPLKGPVTADLDTGTTGAYKIQRVSAAAPPGFYSYLGHVGLYPAIWESDSFEFEKLETGTNEFGLGNWSNRGDLIREEMKTVSGVMPGEFTLFQTYPNPFNPTTVVSYKLQVASFVRLEVSYKLQVASFVRLEVFDIAGRPTGSPLQNGWKEAGYHEVTFDGSGLASGIYVVRLETGDFSASEKMVLIK